MWAAFHSQFPIDDFHRIHRPAALIAASMAGGDPNDRMDYLQPTPEPPINPEEQAMQLMGMN